MNTLHFRYAVEIEKTRSITQAAENLYMAQPNMSKAIKELESTLGITIFRRTSKGVIPTEQGMKFLEYAKQILIQIDNMEAIHSPSKQGKQNLRISVPRSAYIFAAYSEFATDFDISNDISSYIKETSSLETISDVREQNFDFGIIRFNVSDEKYFIDSLKEKDLESQVLWEYEALAVMSKKHPCASKENLSYDNLCRNYVEIIQGDAGIPYHQAVKGTAGSRKIHVFDRGSTFDILANLTSSFTLDSPVPTEFCRRFGLIQRKCGLETHWRDLLIHSSVHHLSDAEIQLVNKIYEVRNRMAFCDFY